MQNKDTLDYNLSKQTLHELKSTWEALEDVFSMHFARYSLSGPKFNALIHLYMTGDRGLTQSELGKKVLISRPSISGLVERLEKEGLVVRNTDPSDKKVFRVCLTNTYIRAIASTICLLETTGLQGLPQILYKPCNR